MSADERAGAEGRRVTDRSTRALERDVPALWNSQDDGADGPGGPVPIVVTIGYLRAVVRRRWLRCVLSGLLGLLAGVLWLVATPDAPVAMTTLILAHDPSDDPATAMSTDVGLATTRTVAENTLAALRSTMSPEALVSSLTVQPMNSTQLLQLTMTAPTGPEAMHRLDSFSQQYLAFRAQQVSAQVDVVIKGYQDQIQQLQTSLTGANARIARLSAKGDTATERLSDAVADRKKINDAIGGLQDQIQQKTLERNSVVVASRVIDPANVRPPAPRRRAVLVLASGLLGGAAIGISLILLRAIVSDRLWLRVEVASALDAPVPLSVRRLRPLPRWTRHVRRLPRGRRWEARRARDRELIGEAILRALPDAGARQSVAVLCLSNANEMRFGVVAAAVRLRRQGRAATIVDLTERGVVTSALDRLRDLAAEDRPDVFRPTSVPSLATNPSGFDASDWDEVALAKARSGVSLVLAELDPAVGVDHLVPWSDVVVVSTTAGRSGAELVRTAGELVRTAGLRLHGAVLLGGPIDDVSTGVTPTPRPGASSPSAATG